MPKRRFNRSFQNKSTHAVLAAGGGHKLAAEALGSVPEAWRERLSIAQIVQGYYRPKAAVKPGKRARNVRGNVTAKSLQPLQLELFRQYIDSPVVTVKHGNPDHSSDDRSSKDRPSEDRPLADLLPPDFYQ